MENSTGRRLPLNIHTPLVDGGILAGAAPANPSDHQGCRPGMQSPCIGESQEEIS